MIKLRCFVIVLSGLLFLPAVAAADCMTSFPEDAPQITITYVTKQSFPWIMGKGTDINYQKPGMTPDIICEAARTAGLRVKLVRNPWKRGLLEIKEGRIDATFHASYNKERAVYGVYPLKNGEFDLGRSINRQRYMFFYNKNAPIQWDGKAFHADKKEPVGVSVGYAVVDTLIDKKIDYTEIRGALSGLKMIKNGRISAMAEIETLANAILDDHPDMKNYIEMHPVPIREKPYFLLISKTFYQKHPEKSERLWDEIGKLAHGPRLAELKRKYQ